MSLRIWSKLSLLPHGLRAISSVPSSSVADVTCTWNGLRQPPSGGLNDDPCHELATGGLYESARKV
jgi:hypothetical protein